MYGTYFAINLLVRAQQYQFEQEFDTYSIPSINASSGLLEIVPDVFYRRQADSCDAKHLAVCESPADQLEITELTPMMIP